MYIWVVIVFGSFIEFYEVVVVWINLFGSVNGIGDEVFVDLIIWQGYWRCIEFCYDVVVKIWNMYFQIFEVVCSFDFFVELIVYLNVGVVISKVFQVEFVSYFVLQFLIVVIFDLGVDFSIGQFEWNGGEVCLCWVFVFLIVVGCDVSLSVIGSNFVKGVESVDMFIGCEILNGNLVVSQFVNVGGKMLCGNFEIWEILWLSGNDYYINGVLCDSWCCQSGICCNVISVKISFFDK